MATSKKPGTLGQKTGVKKWTYNPIECGTAHKGFLAGEPFGVYVHYVNRQSKPCLEQITDGALVCDLCARKFAAEWRGYTPFYTQEYAPQFCLITGEYYEATCEIPHLAPVVISRGKLKTDPAIVRSSPWRTTPIPHSTERAKPVNLSDFLIHLLWQNEELMKWDRLQRIAQKEQEVRPFVASEFEDKDATRMKMLLLKEKLQQRDNEQLGAEMAQVIADATTPKPNGRAFKNRT